MYFIIQSPVDFYELTKGLAPTGEWIQNISGLIRQTPGPGSRLVRKSGFASRIKFWPWRSVQSLSALVLQSLFLTECFVYCYRFILVKQRRIKTQLHCRLTARDWKCDSTFNETRIIGVYWITDIFSATGQDTIWCRTVTRYDTGPDPNSWMTIVATSAILDKYVSLTLWTADSPASIHAHSGRP